MPALSGDWILGFKSGRNNSIKTMRPGSTSVVRNFIFGVEDSLVSTVGLLSGVAITGTSRNYVILTGTILIFVEAFSMAVGSILSEHSAEEYVKRKEIAIKNSVKGGLIMFSSYFVSGFIPLSPYIFLKNNSAFSVSIAFSIVALGLLGVFSGKISGTNIFSNVLKMVLLGGVAIVVGVVVGNLVNVS